MTEPNTSTARTRTARRCARRPTHFQRCLARCDYFHHLARKRSGERKAGRQFLTGRAARETSIGQLSPGQLAWRELKKNRLAMLGLWTYWSFLYLRLHCLRRFSRLIHHWKTSPADVASAITRRCVFVGAKRADSGTSGLSFIKRNAMRNAFRWRR